VSKFLEESQFKTKRFKQNISNKTFQTKILKKRIRRPRCPGSTKALQSKRLRLFTSAMPQPLQPARNLQRACFRC
jgi:hypothetical protein